MNTLEFIAATVNALAWPVVVLTVLAWLRAPLRRMLPEAVTRGRN
jgi:hypothetical protein